MQESTTPITNIHDALTQAVASQRDKIKLANVNVKINPLKKEIAEKILFQNGCTLSTFIRACLDGLIKDYAGETAYQKIEKSAVDIADSV